MNEYKQYMYEMFPDARPYVPLLEKEGDDKPLTSAGGQEPVSKAAEDARKLGLHHTAYGYWADSTGKVVAQSVKLSDGTTQLVRLNRDVPADPDKKRSTDDPTSPDDLDVDNDPDRNTPSEVSSQKEMLDNIGVLSKFPDKFKEFLKFAFGYQHDTGYNPTRLDIPYTEKGTKKTLELHRLSQQSKIGAFPGLMGGGQGQKTPTHIIIGKRAIPLVYVKDGKKEYDIQSMVMAAAEEFAQEIRSGKPTKPKPKPKPAAPSSDTSSQPEPNSRSGRNIDNKSMMKGLRDCLNKELSDYAMFVEQGREGFTPEKYDTLATLVGRLNEFTTNPTKELAEKLVLDYEIGTNSTDSSIVFGILEQYETIKPGELTEWFDSSIDVFNKVSAKQAVLNGKFNNPKHTQGLVLVDIIREALGDDVFDRIMKSTVGLNDMLLPSITFKRNQVTYITPTVTTDPITKLDTVTIGDMQFPWYFPVNEPDDQIRLMLEVLNIEEQKIRNMISYQGSIQGIQNPQEHDIKRIAKEASDSILIYQKRLKILQKTKGECIQFNGRDALPDYIDNIKLQIRNNAWRVKQGSLNDEQNSIVDMLDVFKHISSEQTVDEDMQIKWKQFVNKLARDERLRYIAPALTEHLSAIASLRNGKTVLFPKSTNVQVIDHIALTPLEHMPTIEDLVNVESNLGMILTTLDLTSVKSSVAGNVSKRTGELLTNTAGGGTPAISGLVDYHEFDPRINKAFINFFKSTDKLEQKHADRIIEGIFNDEFMTNMLYDYYGITIANASTRLNRLRDRMSRTNKGELVPNAHRSHVLLGRIGEAMLNAGKTYQLLQNQTFTDTYVRLSDSKNSVVKFQYVYAPDKKMSYNSFKMRIVAQTTPEASRRELIEKEK